MEPSEEDWRRLEELRAGFLGGQGLLGDPWRSERDLELYDAFFAERIAWKWAGALEELALRGWRPPAGTVLDFGCGTGAASRAFLEAFGGAGVRRIELLDRSALAREFAARRVAELHPELEVRGVAAEGGANEGGGPAVLLVSHVLNELEETDLERLLALARRARAVLWVEPGERASSRRLSEVHDRLLAGSRVLAPCPHQRTCGALARAEEWCHHFARPPVEAFTTRAWTLFSRRLGVDLRSLPYAWLALERLPAGSPPPEPGPTSAAAAEGEPVAARVLGRPRADKGRLDLHVCLAGEVRELLLRDRDARPLAKLLRDPRGRPLSMRIELEGDRIARGAAELPPLQVPE